jgi:hypothetical protein
MIWCSGVAPLCAGDEDVPGDVKISKARDLGSARCRRARRATSSDLGGAVLCISRGSAVVIAGAMRFG